MTDPPPQDPAAEPSPAEDERDRCAPCRGTGTVVSGLGGTPREAPCPWCEGTGRRLADHDAQARHRQG